MSESTFAHRDPQLLLGLDAMASVQHDSAQQLEGTENCIAPIAPADRAALQCQRSRTSVALQCCDLSLTAHAPINARLPTSQMAQALMYAYNLPAYSNNCRIDCSRHVTK